jgi:hypothetical protein
VVRLSYGAVLPVFAEESRGEEPASATGKRRVTLFVSFISDNSDQRLTPALLT